MSCNHYVIHLGRDHVADALHNTYRSKKSHQSESRPAGGATFLGNGDARISCLPVYSQNDWLWVKMQGDGYCVEYSVTHEMNLGTSHSIKHRVRSAPHILGTGRYFNLAPRSHEDMTLCPHQTNVFTPRHQAPPTP